MLAGVRKAIGDGIVIAGEKHPVEIVYKDSQSNPNRAAEVTAQLINNDKVDIIIGSSTSDTVLPVADQCELAAVPCVTSDDPWQVYFFGRKGDPKSPLSGPTIFSGALINLVTFLPICGYHCRVIILLAPCLAMMVMATTRMLIFRIFSNRRV